MVKNEEKKRQVLTVDLGDLKPVWIAWCAENSVTPSEGIKEVIKKLTARHEPIPKKKSRAVHGVRDHTRVRKEISLTESEYETALRHANAAGYSFNKWVIALVRAQLTQAPQLGQKEQDLLGESNYQLLAIGRNLNQIAKWLNTNPNDKTAYSLELIERLNEFLRGHVAKSSKVIEANTERWKII